MGAARAVVAVMAKHKQALLQEKASWALMNLGAQVHDNKSRIHDEGGTEALLAALKRLPGHAGVQRQARLRVCPATKSSCYSSPSAWTALRCAFAAGGGGDHQPCCGAPRQQGARALRSLRTENSRRGAAKACSPGYSEDAAARLAPFGPDRGG